jgi:hypothetical protein
VYFANEDKPTETLVPYCKGNQCGRIKRKCTLPLTWIKHPWEAAVLGDAAAGGQVLSLRAPSAAGAGEADEEEHGGEKDDDVTGHLEMRWKKFS